MHSRASRAIAVFCIFGALCSLALFATSSSREEDIPERHRETGRKLLAAEHAVQPSEQTPYAGQNPSCAAQTMEQLNNKVLFTAVLQSLETEPGTPLRVAQTFPALEVQLLQARSLENPAIPRYTAEEIAQVRKAHHIALWTMAGFMRGHGGEGRTLDQHLVSTASLSDRLYQPLRTTLIMILHSIQMFAHVDTGGGELRKLEKDDLTAMFMEAELPLDVVDVLWSWEDVCKDVHKLRTNLSPQQRECVLLRAINDIDEISWDVVPREGQRLKVNERDVDKHCAALRRVGASPMICELMRESMRRTKDLRKQHKGDPRMMGINKGIAWKLQANKRAGGTFRLRLTETVLRQLSGTKQSSL